MTKFATALVIFTLSFTEVASAGQFYKSCREDVKKQNLNEIASRLGTLKPGSDSGESVTYNFEIYAHEKNPPQPSAISFELYWAVSERRNKGKITRDASLLLFVEQQSCQIFDAVLVQ